MVKTVSLFIAILLTFVQMEQTFCQDLLTKANWVKKPIMNKIGPTGTFEAYILDRFVVSDGRTISPARIVFYQIPLSERNSALSSDENIWHVITKGMELEATTSTEVKNTRIFSGVWKSSNRIIQVAVSRDDKYLRYSIANIRENYQEHLSKEIIDLQISLSSSPIKTALQTTINYFFNFNAYSSDNNTEEDVGYVVPEFVSSGLNNIFTSENVGQVLSFAASAAGLSFLSSVAEGAVGYLFQFFSKTPNPTEEEIISKLLESKQKYEEATEKLRTIERGLDQIFEQATAHPEWLEGRSFPQILDNMATINVRLTEQSNAKKQVLREEQIKQIRGQTVDCPDCLNRLPSEIASLDNQIDQLGQIQERLRSSDGICAIMKRDLNKIIDIESNLFNLYNGIFAEHNIDDLRTAIGSRAKTSLNNAHEANRNTRETEQECRARVEKVYNPILQDRLERAHLNWTIEDKTEECHLSWCLVGNNRVPAGENLTRRERRRTDVTCEREGMWDVFRGHTPHDRYHKCSRLVAVLDQTRTEETRQIEEQFNQEKSTRLAACARVAALPARPNQAVDTLVLHQVGQNLEFIEEIISNQRDIQARLSGYQVKKRRLAEICPDI